MILKVDVDIIDDCSGASRFEYAFKRQTSVNAFPTKDLITVEKGQSSVHSPYGSGIYFLYIRAYDKAGNVAEKRFGPYIVSLSCVDDSVKRRLFTVNLAVMAFLE